MFGSCQHPNRHGSENPVPITPLVNLCQVVRSHEPHKPHLRVDSTQCTKGLRSDSAPQHRLDIGDCHAGMANGVGALGHTCGQWCRAGFFERIARTDQPQNPVEPEEFHRRECDMNVAGMGWVEGTSKQPYGLTGRK